MNFPKLELYMHSGLFLTTSHNDTTKSTTNIKKKSTSSSLLKKGIFRSYAHTMNGNIVWEKKKQLNKLNVKVFVF